MPIYEYRCRQCHHEFEALQKMSEAPIQTCPACHKNDAERMVSAAGFQLKGTGWYVTDFRDKTKPNSASSEKTASTSSVNTETKSVNPSTKTTTGKKDD